MRTFLKVTAHVRRHYPKLWDHSGKLNRRIMVRYHLPGIQSSIPLVWNA